MLVAGTVSKTYAMTGWRIGYGLAPEHIIGAINKLQSHSTSNPDIDRAESGGGSTERIRRIRCGSMLAEYRKRRDFVVPRLRQIPLVQCAMPAGAFYAYPNFRAVMDKAGIKTTLELSRTAAE